ncbi:MAG: aspartate-semialdehyde dehydrogenase [Anaerolineae bacterium]
MARSGGRAATRVGILGATGAVGQRFVQLLAGNPWFEITVVAASERSVGQRYADACNWRISADIPPSVRELIVQPCEPAGVGEPRLPCDVLFSALPSSVAGPSEEAFAAAGYAVFSNASAHRMDPDVPLLIPEVNGDHVGLVARQRLHRGWGTGLLVTDPNCSTVGLTLALKPLHDAFGISHVMVTTMQALSGAGYPGVPALDALDNIVPYIGGEEEKMANEPAKLLGVYDPDAGEVRPAEMAISAACNRVGTRDGHLEAVSVKLKHPATAEDLIAAWEGFASEPAALGCPSAVDPAILVRREPDRPQTVLDRDAGRGMAITVGRVRPCSVLDWKFVVLAHNTIRGAAGGSILNAEYLIAKGMLS